MAIGLGSYDPGRVIDTLVQEMEQIEAERLAARRRHDVLSYNEVVMHLERQRHAYSMALQVAHEIRRGTGST